MPKKKDLTPLLDAHQNQISLTFSASDALDTKALGIIAFDIALLIYVLQSALQKNTLALAITVLSLGLATFWAVKALWPKDYIGSVVDLESHPEYLDYIDNQLILQLIADSQAAVIENSNSNLLKSKLCIKAILASAVGAIFILGCIIKV